MTAIVQDKPRLMARGRGGLPGHKHPELATAALRNVSEPVTSNILAARLVGPATSGGDLHLRELEGLGDALL